MTDTTESPSAAGRTAKPNKHVHHGRTLAAWVGTSLALVAFILGAVGVVIQNWVLFWIAAALLVVGLVATVVLQKLGHGAN
jgi:uncharacterized membrane protein YidH (DUF202 family)